MLVRKTEEWNEIWKVTINKVTQVPSTARYSDQELETLKGNFKEAKKFTDEKTIPNQKAFEGSQKQYNNALENNKRIKEKVSKDIKK